MGVSNITVEQPSGTSVPGTELMLDSNESPSQVLLPQPSSNPADPLTWPYWRKVMASLCLVLYTFLMTTAALALSPMFPLIGETFDIPEAKLALLVGVTVITLGYSNFIAIPMSNIFGRRAVSLIFGVLFLVCCIWQAVAKSYSSFLAARAVVGIAAAPSETLMVQVVADLFFLHERGLWLGIYFGALCLGAFIGPVISGAIAERHGWRSFFWLSTGLIAFNLVLILFFLPETKYSRTQHPSGQTEDMDKEPARTVHVESIESFARLEKGRPTLKQFLPIQPAHESWKAFLLHDLFAPIRVSIFPIVLFAALNLMGPANMVLYWNLTESAVLGGPPYNFTPSQVGYSNFGLAGGTVVGMLTAGPLSDLLIKRATARNNGVREAEMRLPAMLPFTILIVIGTVIGGLAMQNTWPWPVLVVVGYGISGMTMTSAPAIAVAYAVDSYKPLAGELMIVGTVFKNTTGFAMTYWVPPMIERDGYMTPLMVWFVFTVAPMLLALPLYFWGKKLRALTRNSPVHTYEEIL
ncbi:major facilitator superfamily domain-containing protein [Aspergillus unguis]